MDTCGCCVPNSWGVEFAAHAAVMSAPPHSLSMVQRSRSVAHTDLWTLMWFLGSSQVWKFPQGELKQKIFPVWIKQFSFSTLLLGWQTCHLSSVGLSDVDLCQQRLTSSNRGVLYHTWPKLCASTKTHFVQPDKTSFVLKLIIIIISTTERSQVFLLMYLGRMFSVFVILCWVFTYKSVSFNCFYFVFF